MDIRELEWIDIGDRDEIKPVRPKKRQTSVRQEMPEIYEIPVMRQKRQVSKEERLRRKKRRRRVRILRGMILTMMFAAMLFSFIGAIKLVDYIYDRGSGKAERQTIANFMVEDVPDHDNRKWKDFYAMELERPELDVQLLTVNDYSRPGEPLPEVKNIFIHYTANKGTSATQNRSYFESLSETHERSASAHFVVGYEGEIVQCIPTKEIAYAVKKRNYDSISIECCYLSEDGSFTEETYQSLIRLTAWLIHKYELTPEDVLRHYDEGGKNCPKYYVEHEDAWQKFLKDLTVYMESVS